MCNAGVAEEAFEIGLRDGREVAIDECECGQQHQHKNELFLKRCESEERLQHSNKNDKTGGFGSHGKECRNGRRRALVDIRNPELEGRGGDLEADSDQDHCQGEEDGGVVRHGNNREVFLNEGEIGFTGHSKNPSDAVDEKSS